MKLGFVLFSTSFAISLFDPFYQQALNWLADETGRLLIRLSDTYAGEFKTSVSNMGEVLKAEPASRLLELALNETYDQAFLDEFELQITDVFATVDEINQATVIENIGGSISDGLHYVHLIVLGDFDKWVNYAGVARHFSDAYVLIANEAEGVPILPTLAGINYYQAVSFIALHMEFLSFLVMIPSSLRETTTDFIDDITNRFNAEFWDFDPTECIMITDDFWDNGFKFIRFVSQQVIVKFGEYFESLGQIYLDTKFIWNTFPTMAQITEQLTRGVPTNHMVVLFLNAVTAESEKLVAFINNIPLLNTAAGILIEAPDIVDTWEPLEIEDELEANWREVKATINPFKSLINQQLTLYQTCSAAKNKRIFGQ